ncbi:helix-turn-helix domain-containing protein [Halobacterium noricense]|uniref:Helix-turn-helix domain-containing protein n=2 Tax=Haladaptatus pallidirubidus TaxID=1008152 RepID=A0AAV3UMJ8_9EURY
MELTNAVHRAVQSTPELGTAVLLSGGIDPTDPTELFSIAGDEAAIRSAFAARDGIRSFDVTTVEDGLTYVYVREAEQEMVDQRRFQDVFTEDTLVATLPIQFHHEGYVEFTLVGTSTDLQRAVRMAGDLADVTVLSIGDGWIGNSGRQQLTDRQRDALRTAAEMGYYENPRRATQDEVAVVLDIAPSTVAEHLRKAESTLVSDALGIDG